MKHSRSLPFLLCLVALCLCVAAVPEARAQAPGILKNGYRNDIGVALPFFTDTDGVRKPLVPGGGTPSIPVNGDDTFAAYQAQRQSGTAFGGFPVQGYGTLEKNTTLLADPAPYIADTVKYPDNTPRNAAGAAIGTATVQLRAAIIGRPVVLFSISYNFGGVIPPPATNDLNQLTNYREEPLNARIKTPVNPVTLLPTGGTIVNATSADPDGIQVVGPTTYLVGLNPQFYWSKHAGKVYATQPGTIQIQWRESATINSRTSSYNIATSPDKPERTIYWTENGFNGPVVDVPAGRVNTVNIIYNTLVPKDVSATDLDAPWPSGAIDYTVTDPALRRYKTFFFENNLIHAYNVEGRVFMEYLGNPRGDANNTSEQKGFEIVNIIKEVPPAKLVVDLGELVGPVSYRDGNRGLTDETFTVSSGTTVYSGAPDVYISGGGGTGATATALLSSAGFVRDITITNPGSGYTGAPTIIFSGGAILTPGTDPSGSAELEAKILAGLGITGNPFLHQQLSSGGATSLYAIRETQPGVANAAKALDNSVLVYWLETAGLGLKWPRQYAGYVQQWPVDTADYSVYARPDAGSPAHVASVSIVAGGGGYTSPPAVSFTGGGGSGAAGFAVLQGGVVTSVAVTNRGGNYTSAPTVSFSGGGGTGAGATAVIFGGLDASLATAVQLDSANNPALVYQDDPANAQAVMLPGNKFYTKVTQSAPSNRALLRFTKDEDIWFERVWSQLDPYYRDPSDLLTRTVTATADALGGLATGFTNISNVQVVNPATGTTLVVGVDYTVNAATGVITLIEKQYVESVATLGTLNVGDNVSVRLYAGFSYDYGWRENLVAWEARSLSLTSAGSTTPLAAVDFRNVNGSFAVANTGTVTPWNYPAGLGVWRTYGPPRFDPLGSSALTSPSFAVTQTGAVTLKLKHRYSFAFYTPGPFPLEGGLIQYSVNGGAWQIVPDNAFAANGYFPTLVYNQGADGDPLVQGRTAFGGKSAGYDFVQTITSAQITFSAPTLPFSTVPTIVDADIGSRMAPDTGAIAANTYGDTAPVYVGYIHQPSGTAFDVDAYKDPFVEGFDEAAKGAIIPVNALPGNDHLEVWWYKKSKPAGSKITATYWPAFVQKYKLRWPATPGQIVLASNKGSDDLPSLQATGRIYYQNDATRPGYNPNEEHALMLNGRAWALRDDLNLTPDGGATWTSSAPYVLLGYTEADQRPAMRVFRVTRGTFTYTAVAGKVLQSPMPLPLLPPPLLPDRSLASYEVPGTQDPVVVSNNLGTTDGAFRHYEKFTWTDRKGILWVYRGPHDGNGVTTPTLLMRYFYATLDGFYYPSRAFNDQPPVGTTITPYLRGGTPGSYVGDPVTGYNPVAGSRKETPMDVTFNPRWPESAPELRVGETLTLPKAGLPQVRGQQSAEFIYQQSVALGTGPMADRQKSARLFDPTRAKVYPLKPTTLANIPASINTSFYLGKTYFPNLPPHLSSRLYFDPAVGANGSLVFKGLYMNELFGEKYLQLNVMSNADLAAARELVPTGADGKSQWDVAINGLGTTMETFVEDPGKLGTFIPLRNETSTTQRAPIMINGFPFFTPFGAAPLVATAPLGTTSGATQRPPVMPGELAEVFYGDTAVDSYAVSASGGGKGFVVLAVGNGRDTDFTSKDGPVSLEVFKINAPLYRGELKVINSQNPLDEKLTLQHTGDFAGHPEEYDFEWRYSPPVDGLPTKLYSFVRKLIVPGAGENWNLIHNPVKSLLDPTQDYTKYRSLGASVPEVVMELTINEGGSQYTSPPVVSITGGGGTGATGTAVLTGGTVSSLLITNRGTGYTSAPAVTFSGGNGSGAAAMAAIGQLVANLPGQITIDDGNGAGANGTSLPNAVLRRTFSATRRPLRLFLSLDVGANDGAVVYLNGAPVASWHSPEFEDSPTTSVPATAPAFDPLPLVFEINANALVASEDDDNNVFTVELYTSADVGSTTDFNLRLEGSQEVENLIGWLPMGLVPGEVASADSMINNEIIPATSGIVAVEGKNRHTIQGTSILTLSDNYVIMRYRAKDPESKAYVAGGGWSKWTEPQLAEGWIKRVLAGINPFQQRIKDLFNHEINTSVSLVQQAGKRWEGNVALNLDNINDSGLVEIYETVLNRGKDLSINGNPGINYGGANDALLLAAGYLSDLYMILGNEAYADAANSTIAFNTSSAANFITQYGDVATALFAFKGQLATVLDEELALLRGRDDSLLPGTKKTPVYNRLVWNYTRGIDAGEAIYALNYNIKDTTWDYSLNTNNAANLPTDGIISAADAAIAYPQGHGDAYGHYLTALTGYYGLLNNPNFSWTPRIEAVLVLGTPVSVDYQDERKFAAAAASVARTASRTLDLTYREEYSASENAGWSQLEDGKGNPNTGITRYWGTDDWASRGGQGALFHWVTANSLLPAVDPNPNHSGIQKIDRTTVPELAEIAAQAASIQQTLDNADGHLNPLGLASGALTFDISPTEVDAGKTHYEQVYERATVALTNAVSAFNNAKGSTQFLRQQEDTLADQRNSINAQEQAFTNQLVEIYGTPYTDDIGPGKTYKQGYEGPDLLHWQSIDFPEVLEDNGEQITYRLPLNPTFAKNLTQGLAALENPNAGTLAATTALNSDYVDFVLNARGDVVKNASWTGRRVSPGGLQTAISDMLLARHELQGVLGPYQETLTTINNQILMYESALTAYQKYRDVTGDTNVEIGTLIGLKAAAVVLKGSFEVSEAATEKTVRAIAAAIPGVVGLSTDVGAPAKGGAFTAAIVGVLSSKTGQLTQEAAIGALDDAIERLQSSYENAQNELDFQSTNRQLLYEIHTNLVNLRNENTAVDVAIRRLDQAQRDVYALQAAGDRIQKARLVFRQHAAAIIQGYRTRDFAFRAFRDEALERYNALFDLSARYTYLTARAYDYETGLLDPDGNTSAAGFYEKIVKARALGVVTNGQPQFAGASTGDPGLSGVLAELAGDWSVAKTRLGFNNPDRYSTTFSLRGEKFRLVPGVDGDLPWRDKLSSYKMANILEDPDVKRYCMQVADPNGNAVPGIVIPFSSTIAAGYNFFGQPLAGGDHTFTPTSFSTKIRSSGLAFQGYVGMDSPTTTSGALGEIGATSPPTYNSGFGDPDALSATPYIYLIPAGVDSMRSPPLGDTSFIRTWAVQDQAIPLPFNIANSDYSSQPAWVSAASLSEPAFTLRKHQAFRAVPDGTNFQSGYGFTNARLIGRSAWNSQWKIVIPGNTLLNDPNLGINTFIKTVKDIKLHLETYSYSGN